MQHARTCLRASSRSLSTSIRATAQFDMNNTQCRTYGMRQRLVHRGVHACTQTSPYSTATPVNTTRNKERIVVLGTGWGGFGLARSLSGTNTHVTVISPSNHFIFTPLLPSSAVGTLEFRAIQEPIRTLPNVEQFYQAKARDIDFDQQEIHCDSIYGSGSFSIKYDKLVLAQGVKTNTFGTKNVVEREGKEVFFLKHLWHARSIRNRTIEVFEIAALPQVNEEEKKRLLSFLIVGGGPTSCEYAAELHDFIDEDMSKLYPELMKYTSLTLVEAADAILGPFDKHLRAYVERLFSKRNTKVRTKTAVTSVELCTVEGFQHESTKALLSDGTEHRFGTLVWSAGLQPVKFTDKVTSKGVQRTKAGRVIIDEYLRVKGHEGKVWAIGDCAECESMPLPLLAQVAQQQSGYLAKVLNKNFREDEKVFHFYSLGSMLSVGKWKGIYDGKNLGDPYGWRAKVTNISGFAAFVTYRTAYWGKQVSWTNKLLIPMYWFKSWAFGRDICRF